jgi:hypothetical protein
VVKVAPSPLLTSPLIPLILALFIISFLFKRLILLLLPLNLAFNFIKFKAIEIILYYIINSKIIIKYKRMLYPIYNKAESFDFIFFISIKAT